LLQRFKQLFEHQNDHIQRDIPVTDYLAVIQCGTTVLYRIKIAHLPVQMPAENFPARVFPYVQTDALK